MDFKAPLKTKQNKNKNKKIKMKKTLLSLSVISGLLISSNSHAQLSWGENITAGSTTLKASHINEIRDAIEDLRTDVDG